MYGWFAFLLYPSGKGEEEDEEEIEREEEEKKGKEEEEEEDSELLQSTSCFLPVFDIALEDDTATPASNLTSLASSLSHAYGFPTKSNGVHVGQDRVSLLSDLLLGEPEGDTEEMPHAAAGGE